MYSYICLSILFPTTYLDKAYMGCHLPSQIRPNILFLHGDKMDRVFIVSSKLLYLWLEIFITLLVLIYLILNDCFFLICVGSIQLILVTKTLLYFYRKDHFDWYIWLDEYLGLNKLPSSVFNIYKLIIFLKKLLCILL